MAADGAGAASTDYPEIIMNALCRHAICRGQMITPRILISVIILVLSAYAAADAQSGRDTFDLEFNTPGNVGGPVNSFYANQFTTAVRRDHVYLLRGRGLAAIIEIVDIRSFPPRSVRLFAPPDAAIRSFSISGDRMLVHDVLGRIIIYNIADPDDPVEIARTSLPPVDVPPVFSGSAVFMADTVTGGTQLHRLELVGNRFISDSLLLEKPFFPSYADSGFVIGSDHAGRGMTIDVSRADTMALVGTYSASRLITGRNGTIGFTESGDIVDLSNPGNPQVLRQVDSTAVPFTVAKIGDSLYMMDGAGFDPAHDTEPGFTLNVYSTVDPLQPVKVGVADSLYLFEVMGATRRGVAVLQERFIFRDNGEQVLDPVFIPLDSVTKPKIQLSNAPLEPNWMATFDTTSFVSSPDGVFRFDARNPSTTLRRVQSPDALGMKSIAADSARMAGVNIRNELVVFDGTDPASARAVGKVPNIRNSQVAVFSGGFVALPNDSTIATVRAGTGVAILDSASVGRNRSIMDLAVNRSSTWVAAPYNSPASFGLQIYSVRNPSRIHSVLEIDGATAHRTMDVEFMGDSMLVAGANDRDTAQTRYHIKLYDLRDTARPRVIGEASGSGRLHSIAAVDSIIVASIQGGSVHLFEIEAGGSVKERAVLHIEPTGTITMRRVSDSEYVAAVIVGGSVTGTKRTNADAAGLRTIRVRRTVLTGAGVPDPGMAPRALVLQPAYPNPATDAAVLAYDLGRAGRVGLRLFDMNGAEVRTVIDEHQEAGRHVVIADVAGLPAGTYIAEVRTADAGHSTVVTVVR